MTYNPNIPAANDFISVSQGQILTNFSQANAIFGQDHVAFDAVSTQNGLHNKVTFVQQGSDPTTGVQELALYSKASGGQPELFIRRQSNGAVQQLTSPFGFSLDSTASAAVQFDASGNILGTAVNVTSVTRNSTGNFTVNFTSNLSSTNVFAIASVQGTPTGASAFIAYGGTVTVSSINVRFIGTLLSGLIPADPVVGSLVVLQV